MKLLLEIRPGEGGDDAKLLVEEQMAIFLKTAERAGIRTQLVEIAPGTRG